MNSRFLFLALVAITALSGAQDVSDPVVEEVVEETNYVCGQNNADKTYLTDEPALICLFFDQMVPVQKVVFTPQVDRFESLQIKGLYDLFKEMQEGDLTVTAMSNGVTSRPAVFKKNLEQAPILNLVVGMESGKINLLEWRNNCFDQQGCSPDDCKDSSVTLNEEKFVEHNCFRSDCADVGRECDT